jgi:hypothetical protein
LPHDGAKSPVIWHGGGSTGEVRGRERRGEKRETTKSNMMDVSGQMFLRLTMTGREKERKKSHQPNCFIEFTLSVKPSQRRRCLALSRDSVRTQLLDLAFLVGHFLALDRLDVLLHLLWNLLADLLGYLVTLLVVAVTVAFFLVAHANRRQASHTVKKPTQSSPWPSILPAFFFVHPVHLGLIDVFAFLFVDQPALGLELGGVDRAAFGDAAIKKRCVRRHVLSSQNSFISMMMLAHLNSLQTFL